MSSLLVFSKAIVSTVCISSSCKAAISAKVSFESSTSAEASGFSTISPGRESEVRVGTELTVEGTEVGFGRSEARADRGVEGAN